MANSAAQTIDREILDLQGGLYDLLPPVRRGALSSLSLIDRKVDYEVIHLPNGLYDTLPLVAEVKLDAIAPAAPAEPCFELIAAPKTAQKAPSPAFRTASLIAVAAAVGMLSGASVWKLSEAGRAGEQVAAVVAPVSVTASPDVRAAEQRPASNAAPSTPKAAPKPSAKVSPSASPKVAATAPVAAPKAAEPPPVAAPAEARPAAEPPVAAPAEARPAAEPPVPGPAVPDLDSAPRPAARSIDSAVATMAIAAAARSAGSCLDADSGTMSMPVHVTFAPSGRVTTAKLAGGSLVGTPAGGCVARTLRTATVGEFDGAPVTISTVIRVR